MFFCKKCGSGDCYALEIYSEFNCDACDNGYHEGDKMHCKVDVCKPKYTI